MPLSETHRGVVVAVTAYSVLAIVLTWPLAAGLTRDVPGDLGDPLLNMWILDWMAMGLIGLARGAMDLTDLWNANIFHPEPLALAFSEHLLGETLQILPVYLGTGNLILSYNLLFLSTFVLAGLGMYLLAFELTGRHDAAFVAGLVFAFTPLRFAQLSHIQILGTQWMPLTLYGFRRFIVHGRWTALAGGTASLVMLGWSCGYYLIYFSPFVVLFVVHQLHAHGRLAELRLWLASAGAAALVATAMAPFLAMYAEARRVHAFDRPLAEVLGFSADLGGYLTASEIVRISGALFRLWPKPEGEVFPGLVALLLAVAALAVAVRTSWRAAADVPPATGWRRAVSIALMVVAVVQLTGLVAAVTTGGVGLSIGGLSIRATGAGRIAASLAAAVAAWLLASARARRVASVLARSWVAFAAAAMLVAVWLSLGPRPTTLGDPIDGFGLYGVLFERVPGFDGLRVPARYAMVAGCFLAALAAAGAATLLRHVARPSLAAAALSALVIVEGFVLPMPVNATWGDGPVVPPARVYPAAEAPPVYQWLASLPQGRVVTELPFGDAAWELRYVYYATVHRQRLVNGYSGGFPRGYLARVAALQRIAVDPERAWRTLIEAGTTHVVLHRSATTEADAELTAAWLASHGARLVKAFNGDELYELTR